MSETLKHIDDIAIKVERLFEKYKFLVESTDCKMEECEFTNCRALAVTFGKEYKTKRCSEILTCILCSRKYCDKHMKTKTDEWMSGICEDCTVD